MKLIRLGVLVFPLMFASAQVTVGQDGDIGKQIARVAGDNAVNFLSPFLSGLGADLNSGLYHSADLHGVLGFDIGLKVSSIIVSDEDKIFDFVMPDELSYGVFTLRAGTDYDKIIPGSPTALGKEQGIEVKAKQGPIAGQTIYTTPKGFDLKYVPLVMPQASVGLPFGLEVIGRFIPTVSLPEDAGKVNFLGFGLRHDLDQYFPTPLPIDIAAHFMTQKLTLTDADDKKLLSGSATAYGIEVSTSAVIFTVYGGFQLESSTWDIEPYDFEDPQSGNTVQVAGFSIDGRNKSRFHAGVRFILAVVNIHADYSFADQPVITAGVGISLR